VTDKLYICPGETHPITRSVHLSRLAAFYPRCRDCALRHETGQLPRQTLARIHSTEHRVERKSLLTDEGLRGVYLNEINRRKAEQAAAALADLLWAHKPLIGRIGQSEGDTSDRRILMRGAHSQAALPLVVVGHDERPCSPDLVTGVVRSLRRMSCRVVDIGLTTRPCFWFAVDHLQAAAGLFVSGAGTDPSWTGFDFVGSQSTPLSRDPCAAGFHLDSLESRMSGFTRRPTRQAGAYRMFQAAVPYEASLWKHFHALRPLVACCGVASRLGRRTIERLFATLPCRLVLMDLPARRRDVLDARDPDVARLRTAVRQQRAHLGVIIDDDGQRCGFLDERGGLVEAATITALIARILLVEHPGSAVALEHGAPAALRGELERLGARLLDGGRTFAQMARAMRSESAVLGGGTSGRVWFRESFPTSDAILTLARVLDVLSRSDAALSSVAASV
jgi:phosphomannomutase